MGTRVQLFVNNVPTALSMVLDRDLICCFEDGSYRVVRGARVAQSVPRAQFHPLRADPPGLRPDPCDVFLRPIGRACAPP